jgi:hypothetical protein
VASGAANSIRQLKAGEKVPAGAQRVGKVYRNADGYQRIRYKTGLRRYVEQYVHRATAKPTGSQEVDHRDGNPGNNARSNLSKLSPSRHATVGNLRRRYAGR